MTKATSDDSTDQARKAARRMLARGVCTPAEAAELAGVSRQLMRYWAKGIDWKAARTEYLRRRFDRSACR
jgi:hypothetical protein